jgi:hypothetical protein
MFYAPTLLIHLIYRQSPAFSDNPMQQMLLERIYATSILIETSGSWRVYLLPLTFMILCGVAYFRKATVDARLRELAFFWLTASICPFLFFIWHPQWLMFPAAAIALTSMIGTKIKSLLLLDLLGMALFVAAVSLAFQNNVDAAMFRADILRVSFHNSYLMGGLFEWFGDHSSNVFLTGFSGYLVLQIVLKVRPLLYGVNTDEAETFDYDDIRLRLCVGLLLFLAPALFAIYRDFIGKEVTIWSNAYGERLELIRNSVIEQSFVADGDSVKSVSLLVSTLGRVGPDDVTVEVVDGAGNSLGKMTKVIPTTQEIWWRDFYFNSIQVKKGTHYAFRVYSAKGASGNAFSLQSSTGDSYRRGEVIIDRRAQGVDLAFRIAFVR